MVILNPGSIGNDTDGQEGNIFHKAHLGDRSRFHIDSHSRGPHGQHRPKLLRSGDKQVARRYEAPAYRRERLGPGQVYKLRPPAGKFFRQSLHLAAGISGTAVNIVIADFVGYHNIEYVGSVV